MAPKRCFNRFPPGPRTRRAAPAPVIPARRRSAGGLPPYCAPLARLLVAALVCAQARGTIAVTVSLGELRDAAADYLSHVAADNA